MIVGFAIVCTAAPTSGTAASCGDLTRLVWSAPESTGAVKDGVPLGQADVLEWGEHTSTIIQGEAGPEIVTRYPAGSINPGNPAAPEGGVGFLKRLPSTWRDGCLFYEVMFEEGFVFGEGGKLPGLFGGVALSGCTTNRDSGFSARYMWGRNGGGFLYPYFADRLERCGDVVASGTFRFTAGRWHSIAQRLRLNAADRSNGLVEIWFDDALVFRKANAHIRASNDIRIEGVMFETFFGGSDPGRSSPVDQSARFRAMRFYVEP